MSDTSHQTTFENVDLIRMIMSDADSEPTLRVVGTADIRVGESAVVAVNGSGVHEWRYADLELVYHGEGDRWTLFVDADRDDVGIAVAAGEVAEFRGALAERMRSALDSAIADAPAPPAAPVPPTEPSGPVEPLRVDAPPAVSNGTEPAAPVLDAAEAARGPVEIDASTDVAEGITVFDPPINAESTPRVVEQARGIGVAPPDPPRFRLQEPRASELDAPSMSSAGPLAALEARNISAWFGDHQVLDRVSLAMRAGQVTALIGPSGCGKSTFLRILNRMHEMIPGAAMGGEVLLDGDDIYDPSKKLTEARKEIGMVFQKPNPFPAMSIYDNVLASFRLSGVKASVQRRDEVVEHCLTKAGLWVEVKDRLRQPGGGLSGGQQQRLCIARALAIQPRVLLMDEPCSALDPTSTRRIEETVIELKRDVTVVIVTHNMQQANRVSDQCAFFLAEQGTPGYIVEHGPTDAMFEHPQDSRTHDYVNGRFG